MKHGLSHKEPKGRGVAERQSQLPLPAMCNAVRLRLPASKRCRVQAWMARAMLERVCLPTSTLIPCSAASVRQQHISQLKRQGRTPRRLIAHSPRGPHLHSAAAKSDAAPRLGQQGKSIGPDGHRMQRHSRESCSTAQYSYTLDSNTPRQGPQPCSAAVCKGRNPTCSCEHCCSQCIHQMAGRSMGPQKFLGAGTHSS